MTTTITPSVYIAEDMGSVFAIFRDQDSDGDCLIQTPLYTDGTYDHNQDNWAEVEDMSERMCFIYEALDQDS